MSGEKQLGEKEPRDTASDSNSSSRNDQRSIHEVKTAERAAEVLGSWEMLSWYASGAGALGDGEEVSCFFPFISGLILLF